MTQINPQLRPLLPLSTAHLSAETRQYLSNLPAGDWPIFGGDTEYGFFINCPEEIDQSLPADLWLCVQFAKSQNAQYILFDRDEDVIPGLIDFTSRPNESAVGMDDAQIETGATTDVVLLPDGVRVSFEKTSETFDSGIEARMFRAAWRALVGRDISGVVRTIIFSDRPKSNGASTTHSASSTGRAKA